MNAGACTAAPRLVLRGVRHDFALRTVLDGVDLDLAAGQVAALVGPSGCGKTTLLHLCAGLSVLRHGRIENGFARPACVFQQARLLPWQRALDNIALGLKAQGVPRGERRRQAGALGARMGLPADDLRKFPHQLSGGMQSRVALARALALGPDLLLLDEPFSALDIGLKLELYGLLLHEQAARGMAVLMITHDLMEAVRLSDRVLVMAPAPGRIVCEFGIARPPAQRDDAFVYRNTAHLLQHEAVRQAFALPALGRVAEAAEGDKAAEADGAKAAGAQADPAVREVHLLRGDDAARTAPAPATAGGIRC